MSDRPVLALDIGGTHTRLGLVWRDGSLTAYRTLPSAGWQSADPLQGLGDLIADCLAAAAPEGAAAVSLGLPAAVHRNKRGIINAPTIPAFDGLPLADLLEARLKLPVLLDRDVVMLYAHAARALSLPATGTTLCFFIGTGIGNLIVLEGRVYNGAGGIAGELGHIPLMDRQAVCGCGQRGCAERYAAGHALVEMREEHFPGEPVETLFTRHPDNAPVADFLQTLALVLATEMIILDPDRVLLGGGVISMPGFPVEALKRLVTARLRDPGAPLQWYLAPDAQRAGVLGAGLHAFSELARTGR